jgi:hypothetical protein
MSAHWGGRRSRGCRRARRQKRRDSRIQTGWTRTSHRSSRPLGDRRDPTRSSRSGRVADRRPSAVAAVFHVRHGRVPDAPIPLSDDATDRRPLRVGRPSDGPQGGARRRSTGVSRVRRTSRAIRRLPRTGGLCRRRRIPTRWNDHIGEPSSIDGDYVFELAASDTPYQQVIYRTRNRGDVTGLILLAAFATGVVRVVLARHLGKMTGRS